MSQSVSFHPERRKKALSCSEFAALIEKMDREEQSVQMATSTNSRSCVKSQPTGSILEATKIRTSHLDPASSPPGDGNHLPCEIPFVSRMLLYKSLNSFCGRSKYEGATYASPDFALLRLDLATAAPTVSVRQPESLLIKPYFDYRMCWRLALNRSS